MDMLAFQDPQALKGLFTFVCAIAAFACYIYFGWVVPIKKIKDKESTKTQKNVFGFILFLFGICPLIYLIYSMIKGRMSKGNANSPNAGGRPPPAVPRNGNEVAVPQGQQIAEGVNASTPSAIAGGQNSAVPK